MSYAPRIPSGIAASIAHREFERARRWLYNPLVEVAAPCIEITGLEQARVLLQFLTNYSADDLYDALQDLHSEGMDLGSIDLNTLLDAVEGVVRDWRQS